MERAKNFSRKKQHNIVKLMDLKEFILDAHNTESCGNVLDLQRLRQDAPQWIEYVKSSIPPLFHLYITLQCFIWWCQLLVHHSSGSLRKHKKQYPHRRTRQISTRPTSDTLRYVAWSRVGYNHPWRFLHICPSWHLGCRDICDTTVRREDMGYSQGEEGKLSWQYRRSFRGVRWHIGWILPTVWGEVRYGNDSPGRRWHAVSKIYNYLH